MYVGRKLLTNLIVFLCIVLPVSAAVNSAEFLQCYCY
jgi:hypothetical protein